MNNQAANNRLSANPSLNSNNIINNNNNVILISERGLVPPSFRQNQELSSTRNHLLSSNAVSNPVSLQQLENHSNLMEDRPSPDIISFKFQDDTVKMLGYRQIINLKVGEVKEVHFRRERQRTKEIRFFYKGRELDSNKTFAEYRIQPNDYILSILQEPRPQPQNQQQRQNDNQVQVQVQMQVNQNQSQELDHNDIRVFQGERTINLFSGFDRMREEFNISQSDVKLARVALHGKYVEFTKNYRNLEYLVDQEEKWLRSDQSIIEKIKTQETFREYDFHSASYDEVNENSSYDAGILRCIFQCAVFFVFGWFLNFISLIGGFLNLHKYGYLKYEIHMLVLGGLVRILYLSYLKSVLGQDVSVFAVI